jgi:predicted nucleotidyltransferase
MDINKKKIMPESFNEDILRAISAITYDEKNIVLAGSFIRKSMRDSSDIDISEKFDSRYTDEDVAHALQIIIKKILKHPEYILLDIKSGLNPNFIDKFNHLGYIKNTIIYDYDYKSTLNEIKENKQYIDKKQYHDLIKSMKPDPNLKEYFDMREKIRKIISLRWTPDEVLQGWKYVNEQPYNLSDSIKTFVTKLDMAFINMGFYTEISNIFMTESSSKYGLTFLPITPNIQNYDEAIKYNLLEFLVHGKYLKALKRLYSLGLQKKDMKLIHQLFPILTSNVGILNKSNSIIKTCIDIISKYGLKYNNEIKLQLNNLKVFLSNIYQFDFDELNVDKQLDEKPSINKLEKLSDKLDEIVNKETKILINENNIIVHKQYVL